MLVVLEYFQLETLKNAVVALIAEDQSIRHLSQQIEFESEEPSESLSRSVVS